MLNSDQPLDDLYLFVKAHMDGGRIHQFYLLMSLGLELLSTGQFLDLDPAHKTKRMFDAV